MSSDSEKDSDEYKSSSSDNDKMRDRNNFSDSSEEEDYSSDETDRATKKIIKENRRIEITKVINRQIRNKNLSIMTPYFNKEIPILYKRFFRWNSFNKIIKEPYYNKMYYDKFLKTCYYCNELKCNPFNFSKFLDKYIPHINNNKIDFDVKNLTCNLCFNRRQYTLDKLYINNKRTNKYLITCCCGITYRNVYKDTYNDCNNLNSNLYKNQNERHYKTPIHQLYITNKEIIDKINNTYNINFLNLNLRKLNSFIKANKDVINVNTSKKIDDNNYRKYKKLELLNLIINVFKPQVNEFIINNTNIYKLKMLDLYKLIKDNNIDIKSIKKYKKEELINKIIEIYTTPPKEFILFNTNIYNLKIVDLYKFINEHNINLIMTRIRSYTKDELVNKIIELHSQ
jgi:hypothetical protein